MGCNPKSIWQGGNIDVWKSSYLKKDKVPGSRIRQGKNSCHLKLLTATMLGNECLMCWLRIWGMNPKIKGRNFKTWAKGWSSEHSRSTICVESRSLKKKCKYFNRPNIHRPFHCDLYHSVEPTIPEWPPIGSPGNFMAWNSGGVQASRRIVHIAWNRQWRRIGDWQNIRINCMPGYFSCNSQQKNIK